MVAAGLSSIGPDSLADGGNASDRKDGSHGSLQVFCLFVKCLVFVGFIKVLIAEKTIIIRYNFAQININPQK